MNILGFVLRLITFFVGGILCCYPGNALPHVTLHAGDATPGNNHRGAKRHGVSPKAQRLDGINSITQSAHKHQLNFVTGTDLLECFNSLDDSRQRGNTHIVDYLGAACAGRALHAIQLDKIETVLRRYLNVIAYSPGTKFYAHRNLIAGSLPQLLYFDDQIVSPEDIRMPRRRAQIDPGWNTPNLCQFRGDFFRHQLAAKARFGALGDIDLQSVSPAHIVNIPA